MSGKIKGVPEGTVVGEDGRVSMPIPHLENETILPPTDDEEDEQ